MIYCSYDTLCFIIAIDGVSVSMMMKLLSKRQQQTFSFLFLQTICCL